MMSMDEAGIMEELLRRVTRRRFVNPPTVYAYQNETAQWVVCVEWSTGPLHFTNIRQCLRAAYWYEDRGQHSEVNQ